MSVDAAALLTIALMALVTYATRIGGFLALGAARPSAFVERFLRAAPKTMFVALVVPALAAGGAAEWLGAATALALMWRTRNLLAAITLASAAVALARLV